MRVILILIMVSVVIMGCEENKSCILVGSGNSFGTNHLEKIKLVTDHVEDLGLPISGKDVAVIIGMAYAVSQIEGGQPGVPVNICFRSGGAGAPEFSVLSLQGKRLIEWQSATKP